MMASILIVDDEKHTRDGLRTMLEEDYDVYVAASIAEASTVMQSEDIELVLTDLRLAGESGMDLVTMALNRAKPPVCIIMTAYGSVDSAVEAMKIGAYDFVTKPVNIDRLEILIRRALQSQKMEVENRELKKQVETRFGMENLIGESPVMHEVFDVIRQVAPSKATVLIEGESGTGKELVAHALHALSPRHNKRLVVVHCKALSPPLLESELFGHEKGAFTGATEKRIGRFEEANGGTIFLDEIGEIDATTQVKILRVLGEARSLQRVGGNQSIQVDVRVISATNRNLEEMVKAGSFRDDLYYRLNVVRVRMPSLRERRSDIPLLANSFLKFFAKENEKPQRQLTSEAMNCLVDHDWPGNVRELRAAIEHGVVMASGAKITLKDLPGSVRNPEKLSSESTAPKTLQAPQSAKPDPFNLENRESEWILRALDECGGNRSKAAERLGISRRTLHRKIKELNVPPRHGDGAAPKNSEV